MNSNKKLTTAVMILIALVAVIWCVWAISSSCSGKKPEPQAEPEPVSEIQTVRMTFPEGRNIMQYGELLEQNGVCTADEFFTAMNTIDFSEQYAFLPSFEKLADRPYKLEGYLFPDTYDFFVPESAESVIKRFLNNFAAKISEAQIASAPSAGEFYNQSFTFDDVITLASIVEREISDVPAEMNGVAAVFCNRMKYPSGTVDGSATGGFFQSDATKFYPYVFETAPEGFVSDYNTFNVKGLPKGPICCPSYDAIAASLNPDKSNGAFFFYTDKNKKVYYAVTYSEHKANYQYCIDNDLVPTW